MKTILQSLLVLVAVALTGCGRTGEQPLGGSGGSEIPATGGDATSSGGTVATASGGSPSQGGSIGAGGSQSQGGSIGAGGSVGTRTGGSATVIPPRAPAVHRVTAASCVGVNSPPEPNPASVSSGSQCTRHADCKAGTNGKCASGIGYSAMWYYCVYDTCATDADCDAGKVCHCTASTPARCLSVGNCRVDADCGGGSRSYCSPSMGPDCSGYHSIDSYRCHTPDDSCIDDSDCTGGDYCNFNDYSGRWTCTAKNMTCAIG